MLAIPGKRSGCPASGPCDFARRECDRQPARRVDVPEQRLRRSPLPLCWPGYQASTIAATRLRHGIVTALAVCSTTTVRGFALATASISWSWSPGRASDGRSMPSPVTSLTNTTATSALRAALTAAARSAGSGGCQPRCSGEPVIEALTAYSTRIGTRLPCGQVSHALEGLVRRSAVDADPLGVAGDHPLATDEELGVARDGEREAIVAGRGRGERPRPARTDPEPGARTEVESIVGSTLVVTGAPAKVGVAPA